MVESGVLWCRMGDKWSETPRITAKGTPKEQLEEGVSLCSWENIIIRLTPKAD